jgi:hypothetical protein
MSFRGMGFVQRAVDEGIRMVHLPQQGTTAGRAPAKVA